jgi:DNA-binding HxlR family transcriptional regulator
MDGIVGAVTLLQVLGAICDEKSQVLFNSIARVGNENNLMDSLKISRKRYYTRLKKLVNADLIKRSDGKYTLTELGKVIYGLQLKLSEAVDNRFRLESLDTMNSSMGIQVGKQNKMLDTLNTDVTQDMSRQQDRAKIVPIPQQSRK